jgi:hypothetical protein
MGNLYESLAIGAFQTLILDSFVSIENDAFWFLGRSFMAAAITDGTSFLATGISF